MKNTLQMIDTLMEIQATNALHTDSSVSFAGNTALNMLRQIKESLERETVTCVKCLSYIDMDSLIREESISKEDAEKEESAGNTGICVLDGCARFVREDDYCSFGAADAK